MSEFVIVDTSVFLNMLNVPAFNQDRTRILQEYENFLDSDAGFYLPIAVVFETGNHIAQLSDGRQRRAYAEEFRTEIRKALEGEAPWRLVLTPDAAHMEAWLRDFPDRAAAGIGASDSSILRFWNEARDAYPRRRVLVWSLDGHLRGYDSGPS